VTGLGIEHQFQYDGSGEMTQLTTPLGGVMQWTYRSFTYGTNVSLREVQYRYLPMFAGESWSFIHNDSTDETEPFHYWTAMLDSQALAFKIWYFEPNSSFYTVPSGADTIALTSLFAQWVNGASYFTLEKLYGYTTDQLGQPYTQAVVNMPDLGEKSGLPDTTTTQTLDIYGNLTQMNVFDYGNTSGTPTRTYNLTYLNSSPYPSMYIRNRLTSATVTTSAGTTTLVTNGYDGNSSLQPSNATYLRDPNYINSSYGSTYWYRGNVTYSSALNTSPVYSSYFDTGVTQSSWDATGDTVSVSLASNDVLPQTLTPNSTPALATSMTYNSAFAVTSVTGPNGATSATAYDSNGRPQSSTSSDGAVTYYTYAYYTSGGQNSQTATVNNGQANQFKKTVLDGFGRTTKVLTGNGTTTVSETDTQYAPCACSPLGKISAVSLPYATGGTPVWTRYTYDSSGRTLTIVKPDGASTTTYAYAANQTTVTDPAGKWKTFTSDAFGNLLTVTEPDPNLGTVATNYTYNNANQLIQVSMARAHINQTRTFQWTGSDLTSTTNPENGTVTYTYDGAHHVTQRLDAKGQQTNYTYDINGRLTLTQHLVGGTVDPTQTITYYYDSLPGNGYQAPFQNLPSGCCSNTAGRLAAVQFVNSNPNVRQNGYDVNQLFYVYSYSQAGRVTMRDLRLTGAGYASPLDLYASYAWDNMGRMTSLSYPLSGPQVAMNYDAMSNLSSETQAPCQSQFQDGGCQTWGSSTPLANASYNFAGQLTMLNYPGGFGQETRGYNSLMQLTSIASSKISMTYNFSATQNNGRIVSSADAVTGENVSYTYDSLNRLIAAASTGVQWSESYSYDGFGNMTGKTSTKGTPANPQVDSTTNRAPIINDYGFDANGNWLGVPGPLVNLVNTWNVENQLVSNGLLDSSGNPFTNTYDPAGKRVLQYSVNASYGPWGTLYFYSITGQRLATYHLYYVTGTPTTLTTSMYFGGRLLAPVDRLGSVRSNANGSIAYFPWGEEEKQSTGYTTPDGTDKYATYFRDGTTNGAGQDYANARYYNNNFGRFWSPDPSGRIAANPADPTSWNRYAYVSDDPINKTDPSGFCSPQDDPPCYSVTGWGGDPGLQGAWNGSGLQGAWNGWGGYTFIFHAIQETNPGGGRGGGGFVQVQPKVPGGNSYTPAQMQALTNGLNNALSHTDQVDCATFYAGGDEDPSLAVAGVLENTLYRLLALPQGPGTGAQTVDLTDVFINTAGAFFNAGANANGTVTVGMPNAAGVQTAFTFANVSTFDGFVLLHELGHQMGVYGADVDAAANGTNSQAVLDHCFSQDAQGVWH
jgi:RHS repeat-associated protein